MDDNSSHLDHVAKLVHLVNALAAQEPAGWSEMKETLIAFYICFNYMCRNHNKIISFI